MTVDRLWHILGKRLSGDATEEELQELEQLLSMHPELYYSVQNIIDLWRLGRQVDDTEARLALKKHLQRLENISTTEIEPQPEIPVNPGETDTLVIELPLRSRRPLMKWLMAAAAVVVILTGAFFLNSTGTSSSTNTQVAKASTNGGATAVAHASKNEISTRSGSHSKIVLPDGSTVWLNAGSKLEYDKNFDREIREVTLNGEAYFDVTKDPERPFIIHAKKINIRVLGTAFNVKSYAEDNLTETSLIHGSIEVTMKDRPGEKIIMKPSQKLVVPDDATMLQLTGKAEEAQPVVMGNINYLPSDSTIIETSWMDNRLIFREKKFIDLAMELQRKYGVAFRFEHKPAAKLMFDGNFKNESVQQALQALQLANHFNYAIKNDTIVITQ